MKVAWAKCSNLGSSGLAGKKSHIAMVNHARSTFTERAARQLRRSVGVGCAIAGRDIWLPKSIGAQDLNQSQRREWNQGLTVRSS